MIGGQKSRLRHLLIKMGIGGLYFLRAAIREFIEGEM
jgi:hypothetical protein